MPRPTSGGDGSASAATGPPGAGLGLTGQRPKIPRGASCRRRPPPAAPGDQPEDELTDGAADLGLGLGLDERLAWFQASETASVVGIWTGHGTRRYWLVASLLKSE